MRRMRAALEPLTKRSRGLLCPVVCSLVLLLLAGGLRLASMELTFPPRLLGDEIYYVEVAANIARGAGHTYPEVSGTTTRAFRPPAHAFLLSTLLGRVSSPVSGDALRRVLLLEVALGTALVLVTALLGALLFDARTGLLAGFLAAFYPNFVAHSHYLWSETLFATLAMGGLCIVVANQRHRSHVLAARGGLVFGAAALTREIAIPVAGIAAAWGWWTAPREGRRRAVVQGALLLLCVGLVILPWTLRNRAVLGRLVPVSTVGWFAVAEGNVLESPDWLRASGPRAASFKAEYLREQGELERSDLARARALEEIRAEQPAWIVKKSLRNLALLFSPDATFLYKIRAGGYGSSLPRFVRILLVGSAVFYALLIVAGVLGISQARGNGRRLLACGVLAGVAAIHVFANATSRFRMPWMPLLMAYASYCALHWRAFRWRPAARRLLPPLLVLLFFFSVCVPYFQKPAAAIWLRASGADAGVGLQRR